MLELTTIYLNEIQNKCPLLEPDQVVAYVEAAIENGFDSSPATCAVLLVFALGAIWCTYPDDARRPAMPNGTDQLDPSQVTMAIPDDRMKESLTYIAMAQQRLWTALADNTLTGAACYSLLGYALLYT
jgi:hypothetical protein